MALLEETVQRCADKGNQVRFKFNSHLCIGTVHGVDGSDMLFTGTIGGTPTQPQYRVPLDQTTDFFENAASIPATGILPVRTVRDLASIPPDILGRITRITLWQRGTGKRVATEVGDEDFVGVGNIAVESPVYVPETGCLLSSSRPRRSFAPSTQVVSVETSEFWSCPDCHSTNSHTLNVCECGGIKPHAKRVVSLVPAT